MNPASAGAYHYPQSKLAFMIMNGFPEAQPEIKQPQSAGKSARETIGYNLPQFWRAEQQRIIGPMWGPGKNHQ